MYEIFTKMLNMSLSAGILVIAVVFLRIFLRNVPKKYICVLWALVAISLVCPVNIPSPMSVFNLLGGNNGADGKVEYFRYNEKTEKPKLSFAVPDCTHHPYIFRQLCISGWQVPPLCCCIQ